MGGGIVARHSVIRLPECGLWLIAAAFAVGCADSSAGNDLRVDATADTSDQDTRDAPKDQAPDSDVLIDVENIDPGIEEVVADAPEVADATPVDPALSCPPDGAASAVSGVLPLPVRVLGWGDAIQVPIGPASVSLDGGSAVENSWLDAFARRFNWIVTTGAAGVRIRMHDAPDWAALTAACPPQAPSSDESYVVRTSTSAEGTMVVDVFAPAERGRRWALETVSQLVTTAPPTTREFLVDDGPATSYRGVLETFYGPPWDVDDRLAIMAEFSRLKLNLYIYASKMDPWMDWIGDYWREDWPDDYLAKLSDMVEAARAQGVQAGIQIRPLSAAIFSSDEDRAATVDKLVLLADLGFGLLAISFDDTDKKLLPADEAAYTTYDEAVVDYTQHVLEAFHARRPAVVLGFVPNDYFTNAPGASTSLPMAGAALASDVAIGWTGPEIVSRTISVADADAAAALLQRKPLLGDNYPVIDQEGPRVNLGPLTGRDPDLPEHLWGLMFNAMPNAFGSLPALATCADYSWNAAAYDPEVSLGSMAKMLAGSAGAAALATMARTNRSVQLQGSQAPLLETALGNFWLAWDAASDLAGPASILREDFFGPFQAVPEGWSTGSASAALKESLLPWADQTGRYGIAGQQALDLLLAKAAGETVDPIVLQSFRDLVDQARALMARPTGGIVQSFLDRSLSTIEAP